VGGDEAAAGDPAADLPASDGAVAGHRRAPGRHRRHDRPLAARPPASQPPLRRSHAPHRAQRRRGAAARPGDAGIGRLPRRARQASPPPSPITGRPRPPRRTARMTTNKANRSRTAALIALLSILVVVLAVGAGLGAAGLLGGPSPTSDSEASDGAEPEDAADEATDPAGAPGDEDAEATEESDETGESDGSDADGSPVPSTVERTRQCPEATKTVTDAGTLRTALESALPGDVIRLEPGTYEGEFVAQTAGTQEEPITLCGDQDAVL